MIVDLDESLKQLLIRELPIPNGEVEVSFDLPKREWGAGRVKPTLNFYLYDIFENVELRRNDWVVERGNNGQSNKFKPPRRINLTYMVTAWAGAVEDEHRLLWRAMAVLLRHPGIPAEVLQGDLQLASEPIRAKVLDQEQIPNLADLWSALDNEFRPALHYRVVLPLDVSRRFSGPMVFTKRVRVEQGLEGSGPFEEIHQVAGVVRDEKGQPLAQAEVQVEERGFLARSDSAGRYTFPNLDPGSYTFIVVAPGRKAKKQKISVPSKAYDLTG
jgi:hypothetical protein